LKEVVQRYNLLLKTGGCEPFNSRLKTGGGGLTSPRKRGSSGTKPLKFNFKPS